MEYPSTEEILGDLEQEAPAQSAPQAAEQVEQTSAQAEAEETPYLDFDKYKTHHVTYTADGREVKEPLERVLQRASQGYHYAQRMAELKERGQQFENWEKERSELSKWKQYDEYAKQNPQWADYVSKMWEEKGRYSSPDLDPDDPHTQRYSALENNFNQVMAELSELKNYINTQETTKAVSEAESVLDKQINDVRAQFKTVDFDKPDGDGQTPELKTLAFMQQTGIKDFGMAFKALYHDTLMETAKSRALESEAATRQKQAKQGIMGVSSTPRFNQATSQQGGSIRGLSYEQLAEMAKSEFGT